jgi:predicted naringenin-chalcone synthase
MFIVGLGITAPPQRYPQRECWDALQKSAPFARLAPRSRAILQKVLCGDNGIATRHLALEPISEVFNLTPDVLLALRDKFGLTESDIRHSTAVLCEFGNLSSPTVFFVLERALHDTVPDGLWWMSAFGAGFSCHGALLEVK